MTESMLFLDLTMEVSQMTFDKIEFDYGDMIMVRCTDGNSFSGMLVDIDIDYDGSYGYDSIGIKFDDGSCLSFMDRDVLEISYL